VGFDGLVVVTSTETDFLPASVTTDQLRTIFDPAAEDTITRWNQVDASWPDEEIQLFAPDTDSGTFDFFTDEIVGDEGLSRADYTASTDDNVLVLVVTDGAGTLGYFGYAYYAENSDRLQVLAVDGVTPTEGTLSDGSYPLARPLFIYVKLSSLQEKPQVREFVRFYLSAEATPLVSEVGYTTISQAELDAARAALEAAIGG
jgi:phosphate transport system substrate-binding protein